ncbi:MULTISPECIES: hypothetical protein [unclassified Beijerinckia]|uniref:hypothetical protein n=1 Tax=unclassified Beijerinckia TaxID=2638183 RepID=UPI00089D21D4|nr:MULTISPECIES: hypothetical protein [unclassified Beijerinckia]MDH7799427.1 hypothetical protein [Beijerinckia sp. GAS462]SED50043.1 hypothetical protein SAMN05443249_5545 [Beijerinckia sp. 28-YEA-48]
MSEDDRGVGGRNSRQDLRVAPPSLKAAVRRARVEQAEQSCVVAELRGAEMARLEMLRDTLEPVLAQVPADVDLFDAGLVPGERPRLFLDMIAYVEMAPDRRVYRFVQDTRHGRITLAESERIDPIVDACTDYIARRLVEREKALASDGLSQPQAPARSVAAPPARADKIAGKVSVAEVAPVAPVQRARVRGWFAHTLMFLIEFLGSIALLILAAGAGYFLWTLIEAWWIAQYGR